MHFLVQIPHYLLVAYNFIQYGPSLKPDPHVHLAFAFLLPLIMAAAAAVKHFASDVPIANKEREVQAATTRYSPWTGMQAPQPSKPNLLGGVLQGGMTGAMMGQQGDYMDAMKESAASGALPNQALNAANQIGSNAGATGMFAPWHFMTGGK